MARTLTPERQKLKQEALSLRYDYGLTEPLIESTALKLSCALIRQIALPKVFP
jgi:hypothetical protein